MIRIVVGSLLAKQERTVEMGCPSNVELRFIKSGITPPRWPAIAKKADYTVVMTKFVSHKHVEALKSAGVKIILCAGGLDSLKHIIERLSQGTYYEEGWRAEHERPN